jgi:sRNA-binding regulator protein Hfq
MKVEIMEMTKDTDVVRESAASAIREKAGKAAVAGMIVKKAPVKPAEKSVEKPAVKAAAKEETPVLSAQKPADSTAAKAASLLLPSAREEGEEKKGVPAQGEKTKAPGQTSQGEKPKFMDSTGRAARRYWEWTKFRIPIEIKLDNGESLAGSLMWYDQYAIKMMTTEGKELVIMKNHIVYIIDTPRVVEASSGESNASAKSTSAAVET